MIYTGRQASVKAADKRMPNASWVVAGAGVLADASAIAGLILTDSNAIRLTGAVLAIVIGSTILTLGWLQRCPINAKIVAAMAIILIGSVILSLTIANKLYQNSRLPTGILAPPSAATSIDSNEKPERYVAYIEVIANYEIIVPYPKMASTDPHYADCVSYEIDLDRPAVGPYIEGDIEVGTQTCQPAHGDMYGDPGPYFGQDPYSLGRGGGPSLAQAGRQRPEPQMCAHIATAEKFGTFPIDDIEVDETGFCAITNTGAIAWLLCTNIRKGIDITFTLSLWRRS